MDFGCIEVVAKRQKNKALSAVKTILVAVSMTCILLGIGNFILLIPGVAGLRQARISRISIHMLIMSTRSWTKSSA